MLCTWGRIGILGRSRVLVYADEAHAQAVLTQLVRRWLQHGYQVTAWR